MLSKLPNSKTSLMRPRVVNGTACGWAFRNYVYVNSMSGQVQTFSRDTPDLIRNKKKSGVFELPPSQIVDTS